MASIARVGFKISGPFNRAARAFTCVEDEQPDVAVLDVSLRDGMSFALARELRRRKIPFLFYASPDRAELIPPEFRDLPLLEKPAHFVLVARLLSRMIREGQVFEGHPRRMLGAGGDVLAEAADPEEMRELVHDMTGAAHLG